MASGYVFQHSPQYQDYLQQLPAVDSAAIVKLRYQCLYEAPGRTREQGAVYAAALSQLDFQRIKIRRGASAEVVDSRGAVGFEVIAKPPPPRLRQVLATFAPWRVGPWRWGEVFIDSEWPCGPRWERIQQQMQGMLRSGAVVADVGCQNGYFMYRALAWSPAVVIGFEPVLKHYYGFHLFQNLLQAPELHFEPFGYEGLQHYARCFDVILCLGVLYHHTDPMAILRRMHQALVPGGRVIIDCQGIAGEAPVALMPQRRYGGHKGYWWLPTLSCLNHWLQRAGFAASAVFYNEVLGVDEQRATEFCRTRSLIDQLDPADPGRTIEGYPAPRRFYVMATK